MQMFGVGLPEIMVILALAVIVIGPDRVPEFAADLARWIRRARAYANHMTADFNEVIAEIEKEAGASREDWKEIASVVSLHAGGIGQELSRVTSTLERVGADATATSTGQANVVPFDASSRAAEAAEDSTAAKESGEVATEEPTEPPVEKPWYEMESASRPRRPE